MLSGYLPFRMVRTFAPSLSPGEHVGGTPTCLTVIFFSRQSPSRCSGHWRLLNFGTLSKANTSTQQPVGGSWAGKQFSPASLRANRGVGNINKTSTWPFSRSQGVLTDHLVPASLPLVENTFGSPPVTNGPLPAFNLSGGPEDDASFNHQEATDDWLQHIMFKLPSLGSLLRKAQELNEEQEYS